MHSNAAGAQSRDVLAATIGAAASARGGGGARSSHNKSMRALAELQGDSHGGGRRGASRGGGVGEPAAATPGGPGVSGEADIPADVPAEPLTAPA